MSVLSTKYMAQKQSEKQLCDWFRVLSTQDQASLLRFAEFLAASSAQAGDSLPAHFPEPNIIERPAEESVIDAIKRLRASYAMLNPDTLLHQTSDLMAEHILKGREAALVIDELERLFAEAYQQGKQQFEQNS